MANLSILTIMAIFIIAAIVTWMAGVYLAKATDTLDSRYNLGDALGGLILLGIAGSLPEIAVVSSAARAGHFDVITGNLIGGLSIQTLVIIIFDYATKKNKPLSYLAGSLLMSLETFFAIALTALAIIGMFLPQKFSLHGIHPFSIVIVAAWFLGLAIINRERKKQRFNATLSVADAGRTHTERRKVENHPFYANKSNLYVLCLFVLAAIATLIAGFFLERTGTAIAVHFNIGSGIFAATVIALVTSLPEISTGLESIFIGDNQLAISDIMGGNAFMLALFLFADIAAQKPILSLSSHGDLVMAILGLVMMAVYGISFLRRSPKRFFRLGIDSILEIFLYGLGIYALTLIK